MHLLEGQTASLGSLHKDCTDNSIAYAVAIATYVRSNPSSGPARAA